MFGYFHYHNHLIRFDNALLSSLYSTHYLFEECKCIDFIDPDGYGNCIKRDNRIPGSPYTCYVTEPSLCKDKKTYKDDIEKSISGDACSGIGIKIALINNSI